MELVGRDAELAVLGRALADVRGGRTRVLGAIGEAGIGKSELLGALAGDAREAGLLVLEGRCAEHERDVPFGVVIDAFDEHVATLAPRRVATVGPELAAVLPAAAERPGATVMAAADAAERFRYHRALRGLLELLARERPVALLLDDLHWADEASLEFVLHLLRRPPRSACLLVFALRPGERGARVLAAARATPGWEHLPLGPLTQEAARSLLAELPDAAVRERVVGEAAGNPLFLRELGRFACRGESALPATLTAAVGLDVAALGPRARALIEGAAVAGDPFDPELAASAAGLEPDAAVLDRLVAAELVRPVRHPPGRSFAFRHPLVRRAVYDGAPPAWRLDAHERAAAALARRGAAPARRAYHVERFARAGDEAAIALLCEAGAAAGATAPATAARWYTGALRLLGDDQLQRRPRPLGKIATALAAVGRLRESRDALVELLDLLGPAPTPQRRSVVAACAAVEGLLGRHADARQRLQEALRDAPAPARGGLMLGLATAAFYGGEPREMRAWARRAAEAAPEDPVLQAEADACLAHGAIWDADTELAARAIDRATARLRALDDDALAARISCAHHLAGAEMAAERFADAAATTTRGLAIARRTQQAQPLAALLIYRAGALANLLELDQARRDIDAAEERARLQGIPQLLAFALWQRALIHHAQRAPHANHDAAEFAELAASLEPSRLITTGLCSTATINADEDPERCLHTILRVAGPELEQALPGWSATLLLTMVRCALALDRHQDAHRWTALAHQRATRLRLPASHLRSANARAELLLATDQPRQAATVALDAAATGERTRTLADATEARLLAGRALAAAGDSMQAKAALQQVAADAGRGSALRLHGTAARELRRLGTRVSAESRRATRGPRPEQLSARERHIAELVADGHSNKHIAATLFLSEKTVRNTLTRVYAKLDVRSRTQLTRTLTLTPRCRLAGDSGA